MGTWSDKNSNLNLWLSTKQSLESQASWAYVPKKQTNDPQNKQANDVPNKQTNDLQNKKWIIFQTNEQTNERSTTRRVGNPRPPSRTSSRSDPSGYIFYLIENMRSQWQSKMSPCIFLGFVSKIRNHNNSE